MNKYHFVEYDKLVIGTLRFDMYGQIRESRTNLRSRQTINKMACFGEHPSDNLPHNEINNNTVWYIDVGEKIWMSPKCRVPRDVIRNSGYKFVRDINDANCIIIPEIRNNYPIYSGNVIVLEKNSNTLCVYSVVRSAGISITESPLSEDEYQQMKDRFDYRDADILSYSTSKKLSVELLPKVEEWKALLTNQYPQRKYMMELTIPIDYPVQINVETLMLWKRANDLNLLAKSIVASDWKDYPTTLLYLIKNEHYDISYYGGEQMRLVLEQIGWDKNANAESILKNRVIEPKDWNMLQDFLMAELDLPPTGGYVEKDKVKDYSDYQELIQRRVAVKPLKISEPMVFKNLTTMIEKS